MEMDEETAQMAAACLGIGTVILCRRQKRKKNVDSEKSGLSRGFQLRETDGAFHRLLKDLEGDPEHYATLYGPSNKYRYQKPILSAHHNS